MAGGKDPTPRRLCLLSPYHGGSHRSWAEGLQSTSLHSVQLLSLPARYWKWRMHGGAVTLARKMRADTDPPELILATDMLDLSLFLALTRRFLSNVPVALYMHENQLTYPLPAEPSQGPMRRQHGERDLHYGFVNYASMLVADRIFFNSEFHLQSWFEELPRFLNRMPEYRERASAGELRSRSRILPVGVDLKRFDRHVEGASLETDRPPLLLWNHRWEYDKGPEEFQAAVSWLVESGVPFRIAVCGQSFVRAPAALETLQQAFPDRIAHFGFADSETYASLLAQADVVVSTSLHDFFGVGIVEAMYCRAFPVLPDRLNYPHLIPPDHRETCLYNDHTGLLERLQWALTHSGEIKRAANQLRQSVAHYDWRVVAPLYDAQLSELCRA